MITVNTDSHYRALVLNFTAVLVLGRMIRLSVLPSAGLLFILGGSYLGLHFLDGDKSS